jgi:tetratricopeptide (TPR) repeat protein
LTADPGTVEKGHSVTLHWSAPGATDLDLEPGVGKVQAEGSAYVSPQESTTYTLTATRSNDTVHSMAYVSVSAPVTPPPIIPTVVTPPPVRPTTPDPGQRERTKVRTTHREEPPIFQIPTGPDPKAVKSTITLGDFHLQRGEYDDAISSYQRGLQLDPSNSVLRQKLAGAINTCKIESKILGESFRCGAN